MRWEVVTGSCALLIALAAAADAAPPPAAVLHEGSNALYSHTFILEDASGALRFSAVRSTPQQFHALTAKERNVGHSTATYWLRFTVNNQAASSSFILALNRTPQSATLYSDTGDEQVSGNSLAFTERPVAVSDIAFRIALPQGAENTYWLRLQFADTVLLDAVMWTESAFWDHWSSRRLCDGLYYGALAALAGYNLFLFLFVRKRDRNYLLYVLFQVSTGLSFATMDEYTFQYLWPAHPVFAMRSLAVLQMLSLAAAVAFARAFLRTRDLSRRLDAAMRAVFVACLAHAVAWAIPIDWLALGVRVSAVIVVALILGAMLALAAIALVVAAAAFSVVRTRSSNARVFLVAWLVLLSAAVMVVLQTVGVITSLGGFTWIKIGSASEAVLLSLALASRINALTRDREDAHHKLLAANAARIEALRRLVSGVAHEVGNPLNFATSGCDAMAAQLDGAPSGDTAVRRAHRLIASGLARIQLIIDNLRCYLSVGDSAVVPTNLAHEIGEALSLTGERLRAAGIQVETEIGALPLVPARPGQLHQVMLNLIGNAIQAMPDGGALRVAAHADDAEVVISVSDTGPGIPPADREKVFEPFFTTRIQTGGTGLGLSVAREIVMKDGGTIQVAEVAAGARFVVSLPRMQPIAPP